MAFVYGQFKENNEFGTEDIITYKSDSDADEKYSSKRPTLWKEENKKESSTSNFVKDWRLRQIFQTFLRIHYSGIVD